MMKKRLWIITIISLLAIMFSSSALAEENGMPAVIMVKTDSALSVDYSNSYEATQRSYSTESKRSKFLEKKLSPVAQLFYERIINQDTTPVDVTEYQLTWEQVEAYVNEASVYDQIVYTAIDKFGFSYWRRGEGTEEYTAKVEFKFSLTKEVYDQRYEKLRQSVDTALQSVDSSMTNAEKTLALHDYLAQSITYGGNTDDPHSAYDALVNQQCVCDGYSKALNLLLSQIDVPSFMVTSDAMNHAWNMVQLEGNWYHVDVTFDDPIRNYDPEPSDYVRYTNFLLTDEQMTNEAEHYGWESPVEAVDKTYINMPRVRGKDQKMSQQTYGDGHWYYTETNAYGYAPTINRTDFYGNNRMDFLKGQRLSGVLYKNDLLYYNEALNIYCFDLKTDQKEWLYTLTKDERGSANPELTQIYSIFANKNGGINYHYFGFDSNLIPYYQVGQFQLEEPIVKGDLNDNGIIDIMDARKAKRAAMKEITLIESEFAAADLNGDGKVDIMEARKIKRAAMKEIVLE